MNGLNVERILNGTPTKKLASQYNTLKESFTKENAEKYKSCYESMDLYDIIENSEYIFKEPYYGSNFYMECIKYFPPSQYKSEYDKVNSYLNGIVDLKCSDKQKSQYLHIKDMLGNMIDRNKNLIAICDHFNNIPNCKINEAELYNALYRYKKSYPNISTIDRDIIDGIIKQCDEPYSFFVYVPKACNMMNDYYGMNAQLKKVYTSNNENLNDDKYQNDMLVKTIASSLSNDVDYQTYIQNIQDPRLKCVMENLSSSSPSNEYNKLYKEDASEYDPCFTTPADAVNRIFDDDIYYEGAQHLNESIYMEKRNKQHVMDNIILELALDMYYNSTNPDHEIFLKNDFTEYGSSITSVMESYMEKESEYELMTEAFFNKNKDSKPKRPKESVTDIIKRKGIQADLKAKKYMAKAETKGLKIKEAGKAVLSAPTTVINRIKGTQNDFKNASEEKKKEMLAKPGYRQKLYKNLKLAILYGGAATTNLSLVPIVMILRSFQKQDDKRIRDEVLNELKTEIKIIDEKISDAQSNGDQKQKYELMRTKDKVEQELVRVTMNGKRM